MVPVPEYRSKISADPSSLRYSLAGSTVEYLRTEGIGLKKGKRRDLESQSENGLHRNNPDRTAILVSSLLHYICNGIIDQMQDSDNGSLQAKVNVSDPSTESDHIPSDWL